MDSYDGSTVRRKSNKGLIIWQSGMAALTSFGAAGVLSSYIGTDGAALYLAVIAALHAGTAVYIGAAKPVETLQAPPSARG